jgi:hypothetical protein
MPLETARVHQLASDERIAAWQVQIDRYKAGVLIDHTDGQCIRQLEAWIAEERACRAPYYRDHGLLDDINT